MNNTTEQLPSIFNRAPDAQFDVMDKLLETAKHDMETSKERAIETNTIEFAELAGTVGMAITTENTGEVPNPYPLTHYSMMQVCRMAKLDTDVVRRLQFHGRNDLAIDNLNTLFPNATGDFKIMLLDSNKRIRALNGADYSRLWDYEMFDQINKILIPNGFVPAVARMGCGQLLRPGRTALFRGDQTSFGFFFTDDIVKQDDQLGGMRQGIMIWNSEVGARSFGFSTFYFREQSGTFVLWDRNREERKRFVHRGNIARGFREYLITVRNAAHAAGGRRHEDMATFQTASNTPFASNFDEAVEKLNKLFDMPKAQAEAVVKASLLPQNASGAEYSVWRISLGISWEAAQTSRAENMVDDSAVGSKVIRRMGK